ncbi:MAG: hypothetical protein JJE17_07970 [Peptostreptococcaceae bacterium]|nr:hypothetical protein [Peptostreptococcaceae bacterium]
MFGEVHYYRTYYKNKHKNEYCYLSDELVGIRPYRKAMSKEADIEEIRKNSGTQFNPKVAKIFIEKVLK